VYSPWRHLVPAAIFPEGATCFPIGRVSSLTKGGVMGLVPIDSIKISPLGGLEEEEEQ